MKIKMRGAILPGNSTVEIKEFDMPTPGLRTGRGKDQSFYHLRIGHPRHLQGSSGQGT